MTLAGPGIERTSMFIEIGSTTELHGHEVLLWRKLGNPAAIILFLQPEKDIERVVNAIPLFRPDLPRLICLESFGVNGGLTLVSFQHDGHRHHSPTRSPASVNTLLPAIR